MYNSSGFQVLAFPCNQFGGQAPASDECERNYTYRRMQLPFNVTNFTIFDKSMHAEDSGLKPPQISSVSAPTLPLTPAGLSQCQRAGLAAALPLPQGRGAQGGRVRVVRRVRDRVELRKVPRQRLGTRRPAASTRRRDAQLAAPALLGTRSPPTPLPYPLF